MPVSLRSIPVIAVTVSTPDRRDRRQRHQVAAGTATEARISLMFTRPGEVPADQDSGDPRHPASNPFLIRREPGERATTYNVSRTRCLWRR